MSVDLIGFNEEFMAKLRKDRLVFVSDAEEMGKKYGLSLAQVDRFLLEGEGSGLGIRDVVFVLLDESEEDGQEY